MKKQIQNRFSSNRCEASPTIRRRDFIKTTGLTTAMLMAGRFSVMAGPFSAEDFDKIIPSDKKLSKEWIASLYARGEALSATGDNLKYIGMPISGICTGQVYLSGDGRLWHWNLDGSRDKKNMGKGPRYLDPDVADSPISQGFAIQAGGKIHTLDAKGFADVKFTNQYPMGKVDYANSACPVKVQLEAYTPFIPLNRDESSYPVIVMRYTIKNTSSKSQEVAIAGWIENFSNSKSGKDAVGQKVSVYRELEDIATIECLAKFPNDETMTSQSDHGSIALGLLGKEKPDMVDLAKDKPGAKGTFILNAGLKDGALAERAFQQPAFASMGRKVTLKAGESGTVSFAIAWRYPVVEHANGFGPKSYITGRNHYATLWPTATHAANQLASREIQLYGATKTWVETWYDSTLPYWFLERSFVPINCMQTQMARRLASEKGAPEHYHLSEGVRCCPGNCTHVWNYAQGLARIFPEIERENREKVEYGLGFDDASGMIYFRYFMQDNPTKDDAIDGTCGTIIRVLRESQMTTDYSFLASIWERVKLSMDFVIKEWDPDEDGILSGPQHNTLDEPWHGQVHWLINVYHAALKASAIMARQIKQPVVAARYERIVEKGAPAVVDLLWNEDFGYFIHKPPADEERMHGSTNGCHIDQVLGDSWMRNLGIDPILPKDKIRKALQALWKYNFTPDVGAYRKIMTNGRWYAAEGDAGLVMCSFPNGKVEPKSGHKNYAGYLNECMTGFEWQVAAHMIWEGMVEEGLAIGKAIFDRYSPEARNPYNEIECSDHYSRAMASYGAFSAACGYRYDGPEGKLAFGPRLSPEAFRSAFTTAEGWGSFTQKITSGKLSVGLELRYGKLELNEFSLDKVKEMKARQANVELDGRPVDASFSVKADRYVLNFKTAILIKTGQRLDITLS